MDLKPYFLAILLLLGNVAQLNCAEEDDDDHHHENECVATVDAFDEVKEALNM